MISLHSKLQEYTVLFYEPVNLVKVSADDNPHSNAMTVLRWFLFLLDNRRRLRGSHKAVYRRMPTRISCFTLPERGDTEWGLEEWFGS